MIKRVSNCQVAVLMLALVGSCLVLNGCANTASSGGGGGGGSAAVSLSPASLTFATQTVSTTSAAQSVTLTSTGSAALSINTIAITGANSGDFAQTNTCGSSVGANANCAISVTFTPTAAGSRTANVSITDNATGSPQIVSLTGMGAGPSASLSPTSLTFASQTVGSTSVAQRVTLSNAGTATLSITSVTLTGADSANFSLPTNTCGSTLDVGLLCTVSVTFTPNAARTFNATLSVSDNAIGSPQTVSLTGTGTAALTVANVTPTSLAFGNVTVNTTSAAQTVTVTNGGTLNFTVNTVSVTTGNPPFAVSGISPALPAMLTPNQSLTFQVTFAPTATVTSNGTVTIVYDVASGLANSTVSLSGTGVLGSSGGPTTCGGGGTPTITTLAIPQATVSANYIAFLGASGGTAPCMWSLTAGTLPGSLTLDSGSGVIFGTAASATGTSSPFTVQVKDSMGLTASEALNIKTDADTKAVCEDVYIDTGSGENPASTPVPVTIGGILNGPHVLPLNDLGTKGLTYNGQAGGLYPGGSNVRPATYETAGLGFANSVQPLDANGNVDLVNGKYVLITIGMSNTRIESIQFLSDAAADTSLNSHLVIVNGAQDGQDAPLLLDPNAAFWTNAKSKVTNTVCGPGTAGCTANQVVVAWVKEAIKGQHGGAPNFPKDAQTLATDLKTIAQNLKINFPNIKLAYLSSRIYAGYAGTVHLLNPEYVSYESGFAVKFAVADSINNVNNLNASAPWMAWGPYLWANGMLPRSDGTVWTCQNLQSDGTHPSSTPPAGGQPPPDPGAEKVSQMLLKFFKTDTTTKGWFCAAGACP